eukprot:GFYU01008726.1.p1 GENE.GFYU01008726.1~~GFYU01008726.1.p1  ORF type:complete len:534 (-),score=128.44 GFYU01008726.1:714-2315(-)
MTIPTLTRRVSALDLVEHDAVTDGVNKLIRKYSDDKTKEMFPEDVLSTMLEAKPDTLLPILEEEDQRTVLFRAFLCSLNARDNMVGLPHKNRVLQLVCKLSVTKTHKEELLDCLGGLFGKFEGYLEPRQNTRQEKDLRQMRELVTVVLLRLTKMNVATSGILDMFGNDIKTMLNTLQDIIKTDIGSTPTAVKYDEDVISAVYRLLEDLTQPHAFHTMLVDVAVQSCNISDFQDNVHSVVRGCMQSTLIPTIMNHLLSKLQTSDAKSRGITTIKATHHTIITQALRFLVNLYNRGEKDSKDFLEYLLATQIHSGLILPYTEQCIQQLPKSTVRGNDARSRQLPIVTTALRVCFECLIMLGLSNDPVVVSMLQGRNFSSELLEYPHILGANVDIFVSLIKYNVIIRAMADSNMQVSQKDSEQLQWALQNTLRVFDEDNLKHIKIVLANDTAMLRRRNTSSFRQVATLLGDDDRLKRYRKRKIKDSAGGDEAVGESKATAGSTKSGAAVSKKSDASTQTDRVQSVDDPLDTTSRLL